MKQKIILSVIAILLICISVCFTIFIPNVKNKEGIENKFLNEKSDYQGVLTCWNIDTFESGTKSKKSFLEKIAIDFEKENRGLYLLVKNITIEECLLQLNNGNKPNLISFGDGLYPFINKYLSKIKTDVKVKNIVEKFIKEQKTVPWCFGFYALISTEEKLKLSGNSAENGLSKIIDNCAYTKQLKRSTKNISSYVYGGSGYTGIQSVLNRISSDVKDSNYTFFEAYEKFINGDASILCGTQRDIVRMENRVAIGKINDYVYECIYDYTDLVQQVGLISSGNDLVDEYAYKFIKYLLSDKVQTAIGEIGLLATKSGIDATGENLIDKLSIKFT